MEIYATRHGMEKVNKAIAGTMHFWEWILGRLMCVVCGWNPVREFPDTSGYPEYYPAESWEAHVVTTHPELLVGTAFREWAKNKKSKPFIWKAIKRIPASQLDVVRSSKS